MKRIAILTLCIIAFSSAISSTHHSTLSGNEHNPEILVENINQVTDILKNSNNHHFSFVELDAKSVKTYSYNRLLETLSEVNAEEEVLADETAATPTTTLTTSSTVKMTEEEENEILFRNICIWTPIGLGLVVFFAVYLMWNMTIPKSTILYATYVTNKNN